MNWLQPLTCLVICLSMAYSTYRNILAERRARAFMPILDLAIPRAMEMFTPRQAATSSEETTGSVLPEGLIIPPGADRIHDEWCLRKKIADITQDVLKSHSFSISYEKAWGMAEAFYLAEVKMFDKPLSSDLEKTLPTIGSITPPPSQAVQAPLQ